MTVWDSEYIDYLLLEHNPIQFFVKMKWNHILDALKLLENKIEGKQWNKKVFHLHFINPNNVIDELVWSCCASLTE